MPDMPAQFQDLRPISDLDLMAGALRTIITNANGEHTNAEIVNASNALRQLMAGQKGTHGGAGSMSRTDLLSELARLKTLTS